MISLNLDRKIFNPIYLKYQLRNQHRYQLYYGGASSGKSFSLAQRAVLDVIRGRNYLITRQVQTTIKRSVFNEISKAISNFKLTTYFDINRSDLIITCKLNHKQILFCGLDDPEKVKSITPIDGVITDIWIEEATEVAYKSYKQLDKRLRGKSAFTKRLTLSFNPVLQDHWIFTEFFGIWKDDRQYVETDEVSILKTTYKDNRFLEPDDVRALESEADRYYYEVYTLGNWGILGALIYKNWRVEAFDPDSFSNYRYGVDWGFSEDPFAFVAIAVDRANRRLYICDEIYETGLLEEESAKRVLERVGSAVVTCDSVPPQNIVRYQRAGVLAEAAKKGPGSIEAGINFIKQFEIIIHPKCCNFKFEISKYKYREDKNGNIMPQAVDKDNHLMDAMRYALEPVMLTREIRVRDRRLLGL